MMHERKQGREGKKLIFCTICTTHSNFYPNGSYPGRRDAKTTVHSMRQLPRVESGSGTKT